MAITTINRGKNKLPMTTRSSVKANQLFQYVDKTGKASGDVFAHFGYGDQLGKYFSVALSGKKQGSLCGSPNNKRVAIVGAFEYDVTFLQKAKVVKTRRDALEAGDVFQVPGTARPEATARGEKPSLYVHLGRVNQDRQVLALNLNTKTLAIGSKMNGVVQKVGDINLNTNLSA